MLTSLAVKNIIENVNKYKAIPIEDVLYTGIIAKANNIKKYQRKNYFRTEYVNFY